MGKTAPFWKKQDTTLVIKSVANASAFRVPKQRAFLILGDSLKQKKEKPTKPSWACGTMEQWQHRDGEWICGVCHPLVS